MCLQLSLLQEISDFTNESLKCVNPLMRTIWEKNVFRKKEDKLHQENQGRDLFRVQINIRLQPSLSQKGTNLINKYVKGLKKKQQEIMS